MADYKNLSNQARRDVLTLVHKAQTSHIASNFSIIDIATVLYENLQPEDKVVWSKGWAAASIYYFNAKYGLGPTEATEQFPNEPYFGLAETTVPGVEVNGGSVGHGLSVAVGMAIGKKRAGEPGIVYCIMSDGELNEGSVWEAVMLAAHHKLDNLIAIVDKNGWQAMGKTEDVVNIPGLSGVFHNFGWEDYTDDGHDFKAIERGLLPPELGVPAVFIAETVKGKGVSFMTEHLLYHYKNVSVEAYEAGMRELQGEVLPEDLVQKLRSGV
jgi:transketolase